MLAQWGHKDVTALLGPAPPLHTHTAAILLFQVHGYVTTTKTIVAMRPLYVYSPKRHSALGTPCSLPDCRLWPCTFERTGKNWVQTQSTNL